MKDGTLMSGSTRSRAVNPEQYCHGNSYGGEMVSNMTKAGSMSGVHKARDDYHSSVQSKAIKSTKTTERRDSIAPASKAFSTLDKSGYKAMPNNNGSAVVKGIYKPGGKR